MDYDKITYYAAEQNADMTEGKGRMVAFDHFNVEDLAVEAVKGKGVMGVGDGQVTKITVTNWADGHTTVEKERVYGTRKDWRGQWGSGYIDNRDAPTEDPDYKEFLRLKAKFGDNQ